MSPRLGRLRRLGASGLLREAAHRVLTRLPVDRLPGGWAPPVYALSFWLTERCNLHCGMCWVETQSPREPMAPSDWLRLADEVRRWRPRITVTGGEPTVYRGCCEVLAGIKARGLYLSLNTNGLGLADLAGELVRIGLDDVSVSLDGMPDTHDAVRGKAGAFARTVEGIAALLRARGSRPWPLVRVTTVLSNRNLGELETLHDELARLGVDCLTLQHRWFLTPKTLALHEREAGRRLGLGGAALHGFLWPDPRPLAGLADVRRRLAARRGLASHLEPGALGGGRGRLLPVAGGGAARVLPLALVPHHDPAGRHRDTLPRPGGGLAPGARVLRDLERPADAALSP